MNWKEIYKNCPLSINEAIKFFGLLHEPDNVIEASDEIFFSMAVHYRELYDFFDSVRLRCFYTDVESLKIRQKNKKAITYYEFEGERLWGNKLMFDKKGGTNLSVRIEDRKGAEQLLFTKAFEILEEQLKKEM